VRLPRILLAGTAVVLAVAATWAFAPVLIFMAAVVVVLGLVAAAMVALARALRRWREDSQGQ
jgi:hypothetical protein